MDIAQSVEHLIVVQKVARSNRVIHPMKPGVLMVLPFERWDFCVLFVRNLRNLRQLRTI